MLKTGGGERDIVSWLRTRSEEEWPAERIGAILSPEVFAQLQTKFQLLDPNLKIKLLYSFLTLRKKQLGDFLEGGFLSNILNLAKSSDEDDWVKIVAEILIKLLISSSATINQDSNPSSSSSSSIDLQLSEPDFNETIRMINETVSNLSSGVQFLPLETVYLNRSLYQSKSLQQNNESQNASQNNIHFKLKKEIHLEASKPPPIQKRSFSREGLDFKGKAEENYHSTKETTNSATPFSRQSSRQDFNLSPPSSHSNEETNNNNSINSNNSSSHLNKMNAGLANSNSGLRVSRGYGNQEKKKMVVLDFNEVKELANKKTINTKKIQEDAERERKKKEKIEEMEKKKQERESQKLKKEEEKKAKTEESEKKKREKAEKDASEDPEKKAKKEKRLKGEEGKEMTEGGEENKPKKEKKPKTPKNPEEKAAKKKKNEGTKKEPSSKRAKVDPSAPLMPVHNPLPSSTFSSPFPTAVKPGVKMSFPFGSDGKPIGLPPKPAVQRQTQMLPMAPSTSTVPPSGIAVKGTAPPHTKIMTVAEALAISSTKFSSNPIKSAVVNNLQNKIMMNAQQGYPIKSSQSPVKQAGLQIPLGVPSPSAPPAGVRPPGVPPTPTSMDELFGTQTNQLTPENRKLIQDFLSGNRENPDPTSGPIKQIVINFERKPEEGPGGFIAEQSIIFEINYEMGTWRKLRRKKREGPINLPAGSPLPPSKQSFPTPVNNPPFPVKAAVASPVKSVLPPQQPVLKTVPITTASPFPSAATAAKPTVPLVTAVHAVDSNSSQPKPNE